MPSAIEPPVVVDPSPVPVQVATGLRDAAILIGGAISLIGFLSKHDLSGAANWLQSNAAVPFLAVLITIATFVYRQYKARRDKAVSVRLANAAPDSVAIVRHAPLWSHKS